MVKIGIMEASNLVIETNERADALHLLDILMDCGYTVNNGKEIPLTFLITEEGFDHE